MRSSNTQPNTRSGMKLLGGRLRCRSSPYPARSRQTASSRSTMNGIHPTWPSLSATRRDERRSSTPDVSQSLSACAAASSSSDGAAPEPAAQFTQVVSGHVDAGSRVEIEVRDSGPGVAPEVRDRIFEPFFSTKTSGSGLGLALVKKIAEDHGGGVSLESTPGEPTRARLWLPAAGSE